MDDKDRKLLIIVASVIGGLGCCGVLGIVGLGMWGASMAPVAPPMPSVTPPSTPYVPPAAGWSEFSFAANCTTGNPSLRLQRLQLAYPATHTALVCTDQQPRPWSYVTFHLEQPSGAAVSQWNVSYSYGPVDFNLLAEAADSLTSQLGAGATTELRQDRMPARGTTLMRRDSTFQVASVMGAFVPGTYIYRQVVVPNPGAPDGVTITYVAPSTNPQADLAANDADLLRFVESIRF